LAHWFVDVYGVVSVVVGLERGELGAIFPRTKRLEVVAIVDARECLAAALVERSITLTLCVLVIVLLEVALLKLDDLVKDYPLHE
jgi:hypothetical protein